MKEFSKFQIASIKRTAQSVYPLVRKRDKLLSEMQSMQRDLDELQTEIDGYQFPVSRITGGYTTDDLIVRTVVDTGNKDKNGNPIKITKYDLKYPDTIIPPTTITSESGTVVVDDDDNVVEEKENIYNAPVNNVEAPINEPFNI